MKLRYKKEIANSLTAPGLIRTAARRKVWGKILKILGKSSMKELVNKYGRFKHRTIFN